MTGIAQLALELGYKVVGSDTAYYQPTLGLLEQMGESGDLTLHQGYHPHHIDPETSLVIIGNALSRGMPIVEAVLSGSIPYTSGPAWFGQTIAPSRKVIAVAGTHGKTTLTAMITHLLREQGIDTGYLIGGNAHNLAISAHVGETYFVIEADEYDTAFFDKRSKFMHYQPSLLIINNLEFDHADIFKDLDAIQTQFHNLIRTMNKEATILARRQPSINQLMAQGVWSCVQWLEQEGAEASQELSDAMGQLAVNTQAALATARWCKIPQGKAQQALKTFTGVARRLELIVKEGDLSVYEDFAHHPTAIASVLESLSRRYPPEHISVLVELGSASMRQGIWDHAIAKILARYPHSTVVKTPLAQQSSRQLTKTIETLLAPHEGNQSPHASIIFSNKNIDAFKTLFFDIIKSRNPV